MSEIAIRIPGEINHKLKKIQAELTLRGAEGEKVTKNDVIDFAADVALEKLSENK